MVMNLFQIWDGSQNKRNCIWDLLYREDELSFLPIWEAYKEEIIQDYGEHLYNIILKQIKSADFTDFFSQGDDWIGFESFIEDDGDSHDWLDFVNVVSSLFPTVYMYYHCESMSSNREAIFLNGEIVEDFLYGTKKCHMEIMSKCVRNFPF